MDGLGMGQMLPYPQRRQHAHAGIGQGRNPAVEARFEHPGGRGDIGHGHPQPTPCQRNSKGKSHQTAARDDDVDISGWSVR